MIFFVAVFLLLTPSLASEVSDAFEKNKIVPNVVPSAPECLLNVTYNNDLQITLGKNVTFTEVVLQPEVTWDADDNTYYTLVMIDPDVFSESKVIQHWLVGNIPGNDVISGVTLAAYLSPTPILGTPAHRYIFIVYEQNGVQNFDDFQITGVTYENALLFDVKSFIEKYKLSPVAGNFFYGSTPVVKDVLKVISSVF